ncbi:hypothetical protein BP5796_06508 [Coleophoma crateriformis]|uniref:Uncharacterized protein n=1 Tax=Coleophoma crateriformis TaxID=565419 RepID=A0A3D8RNP5_9HELO|nr:hypothetical protein BP5796_06508 [Coleophoma crateriformis]
MHFPRFLATSAIWVLSAIPSCSAQDNCTQFTPAGASYNQTGSPVIWFKDLLCPGNKANASCGFFAVGGQRLNSTLNVTTSDPAAFFALAGFNDSVVAYLSSFNTNIGNITVPANQTADVAFTPLMSCVNGSVAQCAANSSVVDGEGLMMCEPITTDITATAFQRPAIGEYSVVITTGQPTNTSAGLQLFTTLKPSSAGGRSRELATWSLVVPLGIAAVLGAL